MITFVAELSVLVLVAFRARGKERVRSADGSRAQERPA
jgi:hypothetical protein